MRPSGLATSPLVQWWLISPAGNAATLVPGGGDLRLAGAVGETKQRIGVGDVEVVAHQRHAERRRQPGQEYGSGLGDAVAVGVAQQDDAVGARNLRSGDALGQLHHDVAEGLWPAWLRVRLGNQHVAVGQDVQPARMVEAAGKGGDAKA